MKAVILTNIPSPYRVSVFDQIAAILGESFIVIYCAKKHPSINWKNTVLKHKHYFLNERVYVKGEQFVPWNPGVFRLLKKINPDIIITCGFNPTMLKAIIYSFFYKKKRIINTDSWELNENGYTFLHILLRKIIYRYAHAFISVSKKGAENFKRYNISDKKIFISPYAIDNNYSAKFINCKRKYDLMFSGQMIERKMPFFFCDVVQELFKEKKDLKVLVLGNGILRDQMLKRLDNIRVDYYYPGFVQKEELPVYYASSKIFLFPTRLDSWGVVANDACAVGTPVITCENSGAAGDLIIHDYNGYIIPLDVTTWVKHILLLLNNNELYHKFSENSLKKIKSYSPEKAAESLCNAINEII